MQRRYLVRIADFGLAALAVLALCGCGGRLGNFDQPDPGDSKLSSLLGFGAPAPQTKTATEPTRHIFCPQIFVLDGTAAAQVHAGAPPTNENLRYQSSVDDVARQCSLDGDRLAIKVGVAGKVLLGPVGAPGNFSVPVRVAVVRQSDNQPVVSKLYHAAVTIASGNDYAAYTIVSEPILVPFIQDHTEDDYSIKVGIDEGPSVEKSNDKRGKS